jgi:hypothetical protein
VKKKERQRMKDRRNDYLKMKDEEELKGRNRKSEKLYNEEGS